MSIVRAAALLGFALLPVTAHGQSGFYTIAVVRDNAPAAVEHVTVSAVMSWDSRDDFSAIWVVARASDDGRWRIVPVQSVQVIPPVVMECAVGPQQTGVACRRSHDSDGKQQVIRVTMQTSNVPTLIAVELAEKKTGHPNLDLSESLRARAIAGLLNGVNTEERGLLLEHCGSDCALTHRHDRFVSMDPERKVPVSSRLRYAVRQWVGLSDPLEIVWRK